MYKRPSLDEQILLHDTLNKTKTNSRWQRDRINSEELSEPRTGVSSSNTSLGNKLVEYQ